MVWSHLHAIPSGAIFGIAFGIAFGFSMEIMSYRKHSNLYHHYEKNLHYFKNNLVKDIHNRFVQFYLECKEEISEIKELKKQILQLQKEQDEIIQVLHEYLEIQVISTKSRSTSFFDSIEDTSQHSRSLSIDLHVPSYGKNDQITPI